MLGSNVISAGFSHSAAINSQGNLYVWGDNKNMQLTSYFKDLVHFPLSYVILGLR